MYTEQVWGEKNTFQWYILLVIFVPKLLESDNYQLSLAVGWYCFLRYSVVLDSWHEGKNALSISKSSCRCRNDEAKPLVRVSALCYLQCFKTI